MVVLTRPVADYGEAMRQGLLAARGDVVVVFDVDYFDPAFVDVVLPRLTEPGGPAIVVGSKRAPGTRDTRPWPRRRDHRRLLDASSASGSGCGSPTRTG